MSVSLPEQFDCRRMVLVGDIATLIDITMFAVNDIRQPVFLLVVVPIRNLWLIQTNAFYALYWGPGEMLLAKPSPPCVFVLLLLFKTVCPPCWSCTAQARALR
jgi:hypothetical protein